MFLSISAEGQDCNAGEKKKFPFTTIGAGADFIAVRRSSAELRQSIQTKAGKLSMSCTRHYFIWINIAQQVACILQFCQFSFEKKTINYIRYGHLPRVTPTLPTVAGSSGVRT